MKQNGTMVTVSQHCQRCGENAFVWRSQPLVLGRYPLGNVLLSYGILVAGATVKKVLLVLQNMGLCAYSCRTFFRHQRKFLFPVILAYWKTYQENLFNEVWKLKETAWSGDGRFDSMGHSAKYGTYTMFCNALSKIVHFEVVQVSSRIHMYWLCYSNIQSEFNQVTMHAEYLFKLCMNFFWSKPDMFTCKMGGLADNVLWREATMVY